MKKNRKGMATSCLLLDLLSPSVANEDAFFLRYGGVMKKKKLRLGFAGFAKNGNGEEDERAELERRVEKFKK